MSSEVLKFFDEVITNKLTRASIEQNQGGLLSCPVPKLNEFVKDKADEMKRMDDGLREAIRKFVPSIKQDLFSNDQARASSAMVDLRFLEDWSHYNLQIAKSQIESVMNYYNTHLDLGIALPGQEKYIKMLNPILKKFLNDNIRFQENIHQIKMKFYRRWGFLPESEFQKRLQKRQRERMERGQKEKQEKLGAGQQVRGRGRPTKKARGFQKKGSAKGKKKGKAVVWCSSGNLEGNVGPGTGRGRRCSFKRLMAMMRKAQKTGGQVINGVTGKVITKKDLPQLRKVSGA